MNRIGKFVHQPFDSISRLKVGQIEGPVGLTGGTVLRFDQGATCAVDVRRAAPGIRETDLLKPENSIEKVNAIVLAGVSVFGLEAMSGVTNYFAENYIGINFSTLSIPIVTDAVLFDLQVGDENAKPNAKMGYMAAKLANQKIIKEGNAGAGMEASVAKTAGIKSSIKGGLGQYSIKLKCGIIVTAIIAVHA